MTILSIILLLVSNAVASRRDKSMLYNRLGHISLSYCFLIIFALPLIYFLVEGLGLYSGLFNITSITQHFNSFLVLLSVIIIQLTAFLPRKVWLKIHESISYILLFKFVHKSNLFNKLAEHFKIVEYPLIILFTVVGGVFFMSCGDTVSIFLSLELQSYALYIMVCINRNSELSTSAGLTYYLLGGLASALVVLSTGFVYANGGGTGLDGHYIMTFTFNLVTLSEVVISRLYNLSYLQTSLLVMATGLLFKISASPFHFWSPDVYDAIPTIVTTFVAIIAKISILVLLLELVHFTSNLVFSNEFNWTHSLLFSSLLSFITGSVLGLSQQRIKKLLAYSTISHIGFILLAMAINTLESIEAFIFYVFQYSLSNLNVFFILIAIGFSIFPLVYKDKESFEKESANLPERNNSPIQLITELRGYYEVNPILALSMAISLFSLIGIPPLMGFFAKQMVLLSALNNGYIFLVIIAVLTSVISASYYLNIIKEMFFFNSSLVLNKSLIFRTFSYSLVFFLHKIKSARTNLHIANDTITGSDNTANVEITNNTSSVDTAYLDTANNTKNTSDYSSYITSISYVENKGITSGTDNTNKNSLDTMFNIHSLRLSGNLTLTISMLTSMSTLFMFVSQEWLRLTRMLSIYIIDT